MYERVMVAFANNPAGQKALSEAIKMTKLHHSKLCIVHVVSEEDAVKQQEGANLLQQIKESVESGLQVETMLLLADVVYGLHGVADAIAKASADWRASLLVLGTNNRRGLKLFVVGSVAENIINKIETSILLVSCKFQLSVL